MLDPDNLMENLTIAFSASLLFIFSWQMIHKLMEAHQTEILRDRWSAYYRNDSRRFHGSDFQFQES